MYIFTIMHFVTQLRKLKFKINSKALLSKLTQNYHVIFEFWDKD